MPDDLTPEIYELPLGPNGLPDLLMISKVRSGDHAIVRAAIVTSDPELRGYWAQRFNCDGEDGIKWAVLFAKERARQHLAEQRGDDLPAAERAIVFKPFSDWDALSVRRTLGFYPAIQTAAGNGSGVALLTLLHEKDTAYRVVITEESAPASYA
ncbi:hypothetical protein [Acidovorax sp. LjRoot117]|uniref:hypothetical protein n=1 Tax=Acidovorax sp. LjRoot117 TaxID=3342255 RepID=UPI003ECE1C03